MSETVPSDYENITNTAGQVEMSERWLKSDLGQAALRRTEALRKQMSPEGSLGLPPLLDERRLEFGIIDQVFERQPLYDRVLLYQIDLFIGRDGTLPGSGLIIPDNAQDKMDKQASAGILCGAGLSALDFLFSNGVQLGDRVEFLRLTPWQIKVAYVLSEWEWIVEMRAGDLCNSIDLRSRIRSGECQIIFDEQTRQHQIRDAEGKLWTPRTPYIAGEY